MQGTMVGVEYADGSAEQWPARIVATDAQHDLAVLAIDAPPERLRPIKVCAPVRNAGKTESCTVSA